MNPQLITNLVIPPVEPKEILSAVGSRRITERDLKDAEKASKAAGLLMKAAGAFLLLDMKTLGSWKFFKKINTSVYIAVVTIGNELERETRHLTAQGNLLDSLMLDAAGSVAAELAADEMEKIIAAHAKDTGNKISLRASPGYGSFPLTDQEIFARILPFKELGISLTTGKMLVPGKSVTFAVAAGKSPPDLRGRWLCAECTLLSCPRRSTEPGAGCFRRGSYPDDKR
jgi:hypothetical protein